MARTSAKAKKSKQEVIKSKTEAANKKPDVNEEAESTKNELSDDLTDKENDSSSFEVEKIVHTRVYRGKKQYLVRWKGCNEDGDTWENESNLSSCKEVLASFKKENEVSKSGDAEANESDESDQEKEKKSEKTSKKNSKTITKKGQTKQQQTNSESENENEGENNLDTSSNKRSKKQTTKVPAKKSKVEDDKKQKSKKEEDSDDDPTDGKDYEVEKILEVHTRRDGTREFLIRWKGYRPSEDTWEPEAHLDCTELIEKFMEKVNKAKSIPARELRETRAPVDRFVGNTKLNGRANLRRNHGTRPCYAEGYPE